MNRSVNHGLFAWARFSALLSGLACAILPTCAAAQESPRATGDFRGIYVDSTAFPLASGGDQTLTTAIRQPGVDGLVLVLGWRDVEPGMGCFEWVQGCLTASPEVLDTWIGKAMAAGKHVELSVRSDLAPGWLFRRGGAIPLKFAYSSQGGTNPCNPETLAAPWDPYFLDQWFRMLAALSVHLHVTYVNGTSEYDAVKLLRLTGVDEDSDELHLPSKNCPTTDPNYVDNIVRWHSAYYTPARLLYGWDQITEAFRFNFPDKIFSVAIIASTYPFPPIADDGSDITPTSDLGREQNLPLLTLAARKLSGHLVIQNNSLYEGVPAQRETIDFVSSLGTMIAFQTNLRLGPAGGASCMRSPLIMCVGADFLALLNTGIHPNQQLRSQYIEAFAPNIVASPAAVSKAHDELVTPPLVGLYFPNPPVFVDSRFNRREVGRFNAESFTGSPIVSIDCPNAMVSHIEGLGRPAATATLTVTGEGHPFVVSCVAVDGANNASEALYPLWSETTPSADDGVSRRR
jgi:hypothetical protein